MGNTPNLSLPYPEPDDSVDVPRDVKALAEAIDPLGILPVGALLMWPVANPPTGYLLCNGQQVSASQYPGLATLLGQAGGQVTLPDYRDRFPVGAGTSMPLGSTGGAASVALTVAQLASHDHGAQTGLMGAANPHSHVFDLGAIQVQAGTGVFVAGGVPAGSGTAFNTRTSDINHRHAVTAQGGGQAHENRPPYRAVNFIIRAG
jgi:microcystin-dependent protein